MAARVFIVAEGRSMSEASRWRLRIAIVGVLVAAACGRSPTDPAVLIESGHASDDGLTGDAISDDGHTSDEPPPPPPVVDCGDGETVFADGFENGDGAWSLGDRWSVAQDPGAFEGQGVLLGTWGSFDVGCDVTSAAVFDVPLGGREWSRLTLELEHRGAACEYDTLWIDVSAPELGAVQYGATPERDDWSSHLSDLTPFSGASQVQIQIVFENVCGDPCGVEWKIDALRVCGER